MNTLIIDDEPLAHEVIMGYAKSIPFLEISGQCYLATEAFTLLQEKEIDLIFLDIHMPKLKGLDFLRSLKRPPIVILTTAYEEYALESYELNVCDYLLKPFRFERFALAVNKALELYRLKQESSRQSAVGSLQKAASSQQSAMSPHSSRLTSHFSPLIPHLLLKSDKKHIQVALGDIYYLESYGNFVKVWQEEAFILTPRTLSSFEEELPEGHFCRIHKSYIINRQYMDYWEGNHLQLKNGQQLPIGKSYRQAFKQFMLNK